jgi:hypothetical protein
MGRWSYEEHRRFMDIAASSKSFDEVVNRTQRHPHAVRKAALASGISLGRQTVSDNRLVAGLKAKAK